MAGAAAGGAPGNLKVTAAALNGGAFAGFGLDAVIGLHSTYPDMPFNSLLNSAGVDAVRQAESLCWVGTIASFAFANIQNYSTRTTPPATSR